MHFSSICIQVLLLPRLALTYRDVEEASALQGKSAVVRALGKRARRGLDLPLAADGAAVGFEVEIALGGDGGVEQTWVTKKGKTVRLPLRDADCLAENAYFHLECDGSRNQGSPRTDDEAKRLANAARKYSSLSDEKKKLIQGDWNGAASKSEEDGHWGYRCLIEVVSNPISTENTHLQLTFLKQIGKLRNALKTGTFDDFIDSYNIAVTGADWKLYQCEKHQRFVPDQGWKMGGDDWAVPDSVPDLTLKVRKVTPKEAQVSFGVPLSTLGCLNADESHDLRVLYCMDHVDPREQAESSGLNAAMGFSTPTEKGITTLFVFFARRKGQKKHGIDFLFQSSPKDLVRQVLTPERSAELAKLAVAYEEGQPESAALDKALKALKIGKNDWLNIFLPRQDNNDRYPEETNTAYGTDVDPFVRKSKEWMLHPHFAPRKAFLMPACGNNCWGIVTESRSSKSPLNMAISDLYQSTVAVNEHARPQVLKAWMSKVAAIQNYRCEDSASAFPQTRSNSSHVSG